MSYSYTSSSTSYSSSTTANGETQTSGSRSMKSSETDSQGNTTHRQASQTLGQPVISETRRYDANGRELLGGTGTSTARIEDVTDQAENDRKYEEAMEDEYAKREGGA